MSRQAWCELDMWRMSGFNKWVMLMKPELPDNEVVTSLQNNYGVYAMDLTFLPLGADRDTAVYRAAAGDGTLFFVKLRKGAFDETAVMLPRFLYEQGIPQIIAPLAATSGRLWEDLGAFRVMVYPFVTGRDAYTVPLADRQWVELGRALRRIHTVTVPAALSGHIQRESYAPVWREIVKTYLDGAPAGVLDDPVAAKTAALLCEQRAVILDLVGRTERLAQALVDRSPEFVLCHADIHAGNLLIQDDGHFYIVDWDNPLLAPKERDLMSIGAGLMGGWRSPQEEERLFYQGYGSTTLDSAALAYYRYERIIDDIAVFCEQLLGTTEGGEDREQSFTYLASNFAPKGTIEIACASDATLEI